MTYFHSAAIKISYSESGKKQFQAHQFSFEKYKTLIKATSLNNYNNYRSM